MSKAPSPNILRPNIFVFHDYRLFLNDYFLFLKSKDKSSSIRKISKAAGVSAAYLSLVLSQKRSLSDKLAGQVAEALELSAPEQSFFKCIVQLDEAPNQAERLKALQNIKRFTQYQQANENQIEAFNYMSKWYYVAIRELAAHPEFSDDTKWIQKQLVKHVPANEITKAMHFLVDHGFLIKNENASYTQTNRNLECHGGIHQISLTQFHRQILEITNELIDQLPKEKRNLTGYTYMMAPESYDEVTQLLEDVKLKLQAIEDRDRKQNGNKKVYHVEMITIPLTGKR